VRHQSDKAALAPINLSIELSVEIRNRGMEAKEVGDGSGQEVLDTIGDEIARRLLIAVRKEPQSAKGLAESCELSLPTVYRRIDALMDHGLVTERTVVADDGNHYKEYRCNFDSTVISLGDQQFDIEIHREENDRDSSAEPWDGFDGK